MITKKESEAKVMTIEEIRSIIEEETGANAPYVEIELSDDIRYYLGHGKQFGDEHPEFREEQIRRKAKQYKNKLTPATAKVGDGATVCLWSDRHAATIIKVTKATVTVQYDKATLDPNFKPEWVAGGFAGHCTNQNEQSYTYERDPNGRVETFHWSKVCNSYGKYGDPRLVSGRHEFYDYNF